MTDKIRKEFEAWFHAYEGPPATSTEELMFSAWQAAQPKWLPIDDYAKGMEEIYVELESGYTTIAWWHDELNEFVPQEFHKIGLFESQPIKYMKIPEGAQGDD
jgi:hypothetical protein